MTIASGPTVSFLKYMGVGADRRPSNTSIAVTMYGGLRCETTACASSSDHDEIWVNREAEASPSLYRMLEEARRILGDFPRVHVSAQSTFLRGSGLSGSAALAASIVRCIVRQFELIAPTETISETASFGSGSAARSVYDGYVLWRREKTWAEQIACPNHWPDLRAIAILLEQAQKSVPSNSAHRMASTSPLYEKRRKFIEKELVHETLNAISQRDLGTIGRISEIDSSLMHDCLRTCDNPINYMAGSTIKTISDFVEWRHRSRVSAFYSLNYGPNIFIIIENSSLEIVISWLKSQPQVRGLAILAPTPELVTEPIWWRREEQEHVGKTN